MDFDSGGADLSNKYRNERDSYGWINRKTFEGHVQDVLLKVRTKDGKVMSKNGLQLPCSLEEFGCNTTSFDPYAYTCDAPDNCVIGIHRKEDVNMIKQGKKLLYCQWTKQHQSASIRGKNKTRIFSVTNQYKYIRPTTTRYTWLSTLADSIWLLGKK